MTKSRFSETQSVSLLKLADAGMPGEGLEALAIPWQLAKKCFEKPIRQAHQDKMRRFPCRVFIDIALMSVTRKLTMYAVCARAYAERGRILRPPLIELSLA